MRLRSLPEGTLGRAFAKYLDDRGLDPNDLEVPDGPADQDFTMKHLYETHDLWHVVTGFETDVAGELGLQAFYLAQAPAVLGLALLSLGLMNSFLFDRPDAERRVAAIAEGWRLGKTAAPFFGVDWKNQWERPVTEIRRELSVTRPLATAV